MNSLNTIYQAGLLQMKNSFSRPMYRFTLLIQPIIYVFLTYMMYKSSENQNFTSFVVLGSGIIALWSCICFSSAGDIERERFMGTLEIIYGAPTSFKIIVCGKILGNTILGLLPLVISFILAFLFIDEPITVAMPVHFFVAILLTVFAFMSISIIFAAFFTMSRNAAILMNCLEFPIFILCGFLLSVDLLPHYLRIVSNILSPTYAINLLRISISGQKISHFNQQAILLISICSIYLIASYFLFNKMDKMIRVSASLGVK